MSLYYKKTSPIIKRFLFFSFPILSEKELDKLLYNYPKLLDSVPDKNEIVQLKILLFCLNTRIGSSLFFKSINKVEQLSDEKILTFFEENLKSKIMLKRKAAFNILSIIGVLITRSNNIATKKLWESCGIDNNNIENECKHYQKNIMDLREHHSSELSSQIICPEKYQEYDINENKCIYHLSDFNIMKKFNITQESLDNISGYNI